MANAYKRTQYIKQQSLPRTNPKSTLDPQEDNSKRDIIHTSATLKMKKVKERNFPSIFGNLKTNNKNYELRWEIMHKSGELKNIGKTCKTCNLEKIEIGLANKERSLNKRQEIFYSCPHFRKLYFKT